MAEFLNTKTKEEKFNNQNKVTDSAHFKDGWIPN
jgi:hypothetical protein